MILGVGRTKPAIDAGRAWVRKALDQTAHHETVPMSYDDLVVGTICGGSDSTSGMTANPAVGLAFDALVDRGATAIFEETGELMGCEPLLEARAANDGVKQAISNAMDKAAQHYADLGQPSFAPGNAEGGLTTIEEKSLGAYAKSGSRPIAGADLIGNLGFELVAETAATQTWNSWNPDGTPAPDGCFSMSSLADDLVDAGQLKPDDRQRFTSTIHHAARDGRFSMALTMLAVVARAPTIGG